MHRTLPRAAVLGLLVASLAFAASGVAFAEGEDAPAADTIQWVEGWEAGKAQAAKDGKLIFLYFGRKSPT